MGESRRTEKLLRAGGGALIAMGAAVVLTSCSLLGGTPGAADPTSTAIVIDPSVPSATATATPVATVTPSPTPTDVVTIAPAPAPSSTTTPIDTRTAVTPFITSATATGSRIDVSAIVPKIIESDGTCTLTATRGDDVQTAKATAAAAASYTGCQPLSLKGLHAGTWQVRLEYSSTQSTGLSADRTVTVG